MGRLFLYLGDDDLMANDHLEFKEQLDLFLSRGMISLNYEEDALKLEHIPYYKLKEFAEFYATKSEDANGTTVINYNGVSFSDVLKRYYQDKNLRIFLLHAIEKIEISLKNKIAYVLGKQHGPFGYLKFANWCNREEYCKHYLHAKQEKLKSKIRKEIRKNKKNAPNEVSIKSQECNGQLPVWLMVNLLTFGGTIEILELMSHKNIKKVANAYGSTPNEFISHMKCFHLIRNLCAHNEKVIDLELKSTPSIPSRYKDIFYITRSGAKTKRMAVPIMLIAKYTLSINPQYKTINIIKTVKSICSSEKLAKQFGFLDKDSMKKAMCMITPIKKTVNHL